MLNTIVLVKLSKGDERATIKSKYNEDVYENDHTSVWGSFWFNHHWGYKCCHSFIRNSYCPGFVLTEEDQRQLLQQQQTHHSDDRQAEKSLVDLHREKLAKQKGIAAAAAAGKDGEKVKLDKKKVQEAAKKLEEKERKADELSKQDERKRKYNSSMKGGEGEGEEDDLHVPTEEELEAYRLKKFRHDDPMSHFMLNS